MIDLLPIFATITFIMPFLFKREIEMRLGCLLFLCCTVLNTEGYEPKHEIPCTSPSARDDEKDKVKLPASSTTLIPPLSGAMAYTQAIIATGSSNVLLSFLLLYMGGRMLGKIGIRDDKNLFHVGAGFAVLATVPSLAAWIVHRCVRPYLFEPIRALHNTAPKLYYGTVFIGAYPVAIGISIGTSAGA